MYFMESKSSTDEMNIKVAVRCRPLNDEEKRGNVCSVVRCNPDLKKIRISYGSSSKRLSKDYTFDNVFGTYSTQVYSIVYSCFISRMNLSFKKK